jgi:glycosyltransferase involved in cell wall biosynthesis
MRIGIDARSAIGQHARGEGKCLLALYQQIARLRPQWEFVFYGSGAAEGSERLRQAVPQARIRSFDIPGFRWNSWENLGLPWHALRDRIDVLHSFSSGAPHWSPAPIVMTVHDIIPLVADDGLTPESIERFRRRLAAGLRSADHIVTVSENTRQDLLRTFGGLAAKKMSVVPWGGPVPQDALLQQKLAYWASAFEQGHVLALGGGGAKRKNMPGVIRVFAQVCAQRPQARLRLIGVTSQAERQQAESQVQSLGITDKVEISGYVSEQDLEAAYLQANCLLYLSRYEGFGLPPLEAMARGVPVVACRTSSIPEVVGDAAVLIDADDEAAAAAAVLSLLTDRQRCSGLLEQGRQRALQFSWNAAAEAMLAVLESAARSRP